MTRGGTGPGRRVLFGALFLLPAAILAAHAWMYYFLCDDAFISFRYARNLKDGFGLVFNVGEHVEGYTNFLWVVELAGIWKVLGVGPETASIVLSLLFTAGTAALAVSLAGAPQHRQSWSASWAALVLLAANRSFAVWSTSGLETRQFTFFVILGVWAVRRWPESERWLWIASLAFAAAELTRPEAVLLWGSAMAWLLLDAWRRGRAWLPAALRLGIPFLAVTALHYLGRRLYYGEWLPNTYYAKAVRSWVEAGVHYFTAASIENGLYLLVPLGLLGGWAVWRRSKDIIHLLAALLILPHAAYLLVIGGDHFEYRPLDFWWPLIAAATGAGVAEVAGGVARRGGEVGTLLSRVGAAALLVLALVYGNAMGLASHLLTRDLTARNETFSINPELVPERSPLLFRVPGMSFLTPAYNASLTFCIDHAVGRRQVEHKGLWLLRKQLWGPYESVARRGVVPPGMVMAMGVVGIAPYHLPDVEVIDALGLTDKVIARSPVEKPNEQRRMAHDRQPPPGYLERRGVNIRVRPAGRTLEEALTMAPLAIHLAPDLWMPFRIERAHLLAGPLAGQEIHSRSGARLGLAATPAEGGEPDPVAPGTTPPPL